jgi:hypothetical protein
MIIRSNTSGTTETATPADAAMDQHFMLEEGMACVCDALDLLDDGGSREQIMERPYSALDTLEYYAKETIKQEPR